MKQILPESIRNSLVRHRYNPEEVLVAALTDINSYGKYDHQWLVATSNKLFIFDSEFGDDPLFTFDLDEIQEFRTMAAVGSGLLQIRIEDIWLDLMRFSNRLKYRFDQTIRQLNQLKRGDHLAPQKESDPQRCDRCGLMLEFAGEMCPRCIDHGAALGRMVSLLKPYWTSVTALSSLLIIGIILDMAWPIFTRYLVDHVLTASNPDRNPPLHILQDRQPKELLIIIVCALAGVQIARAAINMISGRITSVVSNRMTFDIRGRLVRKLEELGLSYYGRHETGSLVGRTVYDTDAIQGFLNQITSGFFMQFLLVIFSFLMMFSLRPKLALWTVLPAPFVMIGTLIYWKKVHPNFQKFWDRSSKQAGLLSSILTGIRVVKVFGQEENEYNRFQEYSHEVRRAREKLDRTSAYFYPMVAIVFQVGGWIIWYIGGNTVLGERMSLGTLMAFFAYLSLFYGPLGNLTNITTWMTQFSTQMYRIFDILDTPTTLPTSPSLMSPLALRGEIEFKEVTFSYSRGTPVLNGLSLRIKEGERVGIVGKSGSGKTSLVNLICRFYDADSGEVLLDGVDIRNLTKAALRSRVSIVLQDPFLFKGSLLENIQYGKPDATREEVIEAARAANAHDFVMKHALAYDSSVGERGQELSGGERQRISIARALLYPTPILILDEATSSVDSESEMAIQQALDEIASERTTIIVAHRLSTLSKCDRIYFVEEGKVAESGTHAELMEQKGKYHDWIKIQGEGALNPDYETPPESIETRWLDPTIDRIERGSLHDLQVKLMDARRIRGCFALRCFPIHHPDQYISIRYVDSRNQIHEVGIIRDLQAWPTSAQKALLESLERRYFFHTIQRIHSIKKISQFLEFKAATNLGVVEFTLRNEPDSAQSYGKKGKLLMDVEDNLYVIADIKSLARADREMLNRYIYW